MSATQPFSVKLGFVLKALRISRAQLAAEMGVDKSVVGRWATGSVRPSDHTLAKLTSVVATRVEGFTVLDWERDLERLGNRVGMDTDGLFETTRWRSGDGLPLPLMDRILETTERRGDAYEGFFRSTRPYSQMPGRFLHDQMMVRKDGRGLLRFDMACGGVFVEGWVLPLQNQLFIIGAELTSDTLAFGIFNGVKNLRAGVLDGLVLNSALDVSGTPTATAAIFERMDDLSGDPEADDARFAELARLDPVAPEGTVPTKVVAHLARDIGPAQMALGGDWVLRLPLSRSLSRGHGSGVDGEMDGRSSLVR